MIRDTHLTDFVTKRRDRTVKLLIALAIPCIGALWYSEFRMGLLTFLGNYYYPFLLVVFSISTLTIAIVPRLRLYAEWLAYGGLAAYFVFALGSFAVLQSKLSIYALANTLQWMPILYVTAFVFLKRREAVVATICLFLLSLVPTIAVSILRPHAWIPMIAVLIFNAYVIHLLTILSLSLVIVTSRQLERTADRARVFAAEARVDPLTGLLNRRGFQEKFVDASNLGVGSAAIMMLDLDRFKQVNDNHGHLVGDEVIMHIGKVIRDGIRGGDIVCRWGGEEFLVAIFESAERDAMVIADSIRTAVAASSHPVAGTVTTSVGVAMWTPGSSSQTAIRKADEALYEAKLAGRNRVHVGGVA